MSRVLRGAVSPVDGSALTLAERRLAGGSIGLGDPSADTLVYVIAGEGSLTLDGADHPLTTGSALTVAAGDTADATGELDLLVVEVGPGVDLHAPTGPPQAVVDPAAAASESATGKRSADVLLGPHVACVRATMFVGHIPPGKAPWHYHLYDEIVWIRAGSGRLHLDGGVEELAPGSVFRLRPRELHSVENASPTEELTVVGIFTPAGSPTAAYLPA